ncbi:recombinase family protein [Acetobacter orleanensis]|uniref:Resolvase n=1 Tax=Acetobacter orleanensis TaxID=104099 RepID=A0A4Y3TL11_9PROT|nr:recombinase family protein [Acetobacter orleanensis]KXV62307.1 resolvase [Acetobacter orleanensis]PCD79476.1 resolvase [Acetobacter orleanensis]GAN69123.1 DNA recombinase/resolvase [Acetobacter orleanensis JCM 7639]GBR25795.1 DNA resolvase [Acetobacter orleanensis NRIC 0473]GEB82612.1 resolvase [Acetobacter orleanensis]
MSDGRFIAYYRVSTERQGKSGLGLEAQQKSVLDYLSGANSTLVAEFTDIESGKNNSRPELTKALSLAKLTGAILIIAKLDRLSRNATFLMSLRDAGVEFVAVDLPNANRLTVGIMALVAEQEREVISGRTKAALEAAKARGVKLGGYRAEAKPDAAKGLAGIKKKADHFAVSVMPIVREIQARGVTSLNGIAKELILRGIKTNRGGIWTATTVKNLISRNSLI